jgi:uncharacterized protein YdeI (YjbR/CyaY-like superfamily)
MSVPHADRERVHPGSRQEWRAWLAANAATSPGVWLVSWRRQSGRPALDYEAAVCEALCFGWIDSTAKKLDDDRTMLHFGPRKPGSGWARPNKLRVERLVADGSMTEAGLRLIEAAKRDGSWTRLDDVEDLVVPADLAAAFDRHPGSREQWESFPPSARRAILQWIVQAKRPQTRAARLEETARLAAAGQRANQPRPKR